MSDVVRHKAGCAEEFAEQLAEKLGGKLYRVVLFGSVAKGTADVDSDVDVLVVVDRVSEDVKNIVAEAAFQVGLSCGEAIEYILMDLEEYRSRDPTTHSSTKSKSGVGYSMKIQSQRCEEPLDSLSLLRSTIATPRSVGRTLCTELLSTWGRMLLSSCSKL